MLLTLEKVLVLKNVPLFAGIPEAALSDIVAAADETAAMIGTDVVKAGEPWNDMYIILQGQVRLHRNGLTVKELNAPDVFGELAALDQAAADVTATAVEDSSFFKISGTALYRLMNEHKALERNIIKDLCGRIRKLRAERQQG